MQSLPNEILSIIYLQLSPHQCYQLSLTSKLLFSIFLINRSQLLEKSIEEWGCLLFKCPICIKVYLNRETVMCISYQSNLSEELIRACRKCRKIIKRRNSLIVLDILEKNSINRFESEFPFGNKTLKTLKFIAEKLGA